MGQFLTILSHQKKSKAELQFFHSHSLTKISQFYQQYKSISDTLAIDDSEFTQIFGQHLNVFQILDTDKNLLIDGLELFAGLILYSKIIKFQDKIQFLFNLFDFNEQNSLFPNDLQFMFLSCCTFSHKIYGLRSQLNQLWIQQFVKSEFFNGENKINISEIMKWAKQSTIVTIFFQQILQKPQKDNSKVLDQMLYVQYEHSDSNDAQMAASLNQKFYQKYMLKVKQKFQTFYEQKYNNYANCDVLFGTDWIYGIRIKDVKKVFLNVYDKRGNVQIAYFVGSIAILYKPQSKSQRHYRQHKHPIISITTNQSTRVIATGQYRSKPQINIWNYYSMKTLINIKTNHKNGVHLMNFTSNGKLLINAGCGQQGSLNIHNIENGQLLYSAVCSTPIVDINQLINFTSNPAMQFLMTGLYQIHYFSCDRQSKNESIKSHKQSSIKQFIIQSFEHSDKSFHSKITCSAFYYINRNLSYLNQYDQKFNKYILTGHENGQVNVWNPQYQIFQFMLTQQKSQIIKILITRHYIIIASDSSYINFWDINIQKRQNKKVIDITQINYRLYSYNIRDIIPLKRKPNDNVQQEYLICTVKGDVFILGKQIKNDQILRFSLIEKDFQITMIQQIFPIEGEIITSKVINKDNNNTSSSYFNKKKQDIVQIYYGGNLGIINTINTGSHLKVGSWNIGQKIIYFDVGQSKNHDTMIVAATESNKIYTKIGNIECTQKIQISTNISFLIISEDNQTLIVSTSQNDQHNLLIFLLNPKLNFNLIHTVTPSQKIIFMESIQKKTIIAVTQNNNILLVSLKDFHIKPFQSLEKNFPNPMIEFIYYLKQKNRYLPMVLGAQSKTLAMANTNGKINIWRNSEQLQDGCKIVLYGHCSYCSSLILNKNQTKMFSTGYEDNMIIQWNSKFIIQRNSVLTANLFKIQVIQDDQDQFLQRQVSFCTFKNNLLTQLYDQHLLIRGIGSNNDTLTKLFKGMIQQWKIFNHYPNIKDQPSLNLKLDFVFGVEVFNKSNTVLSLNNRKIAYFVSRLVIIYDPSNNKQEIYTGHRFKVTCIYKLQKLNKQLIASGQSSYHPKINIWCVQTLQTLKIIQTNHRFGIINIYVEGDYLLSYGLKQVSNFNFSSSGKNNQNQSMNYQSNKQTYQFELINIFTEQKVSTLTDKYPVYCMLINPLNHNQIVISRSGQIIFYHNVNGFMKKKSICYVDDQNVTSMIFYKINQSQVDLLVGTKKGSIGVINKQKNFIIIKPKAHQQRINNFIMIKIQDKKFFVTSSEDQTLKIWCKKFNQIYFSQMKRNQPDQILKANSTSKNNQNIVQRSKAVQSISIFDQTDKSRGPSLLLGTRNGDIYELMIQKDFSQKQPFKNSKYLLYIKTNITQSPILQTKKVLVTHHPKLQIIVTIGQDQNLIFWDTDGNRFIFNKYLGYSSIPTAIKFSKDGDYLIIGFNDGLLIFLDSKISKSLQGKTDQKFLMPSFSLIKKQKAEQNNAILNIQLSDSGEHLAVSYNYKIITTKQKKSVSSNSFISLFNNKSRDKMKNFSKLDSGKIFQKFTSITCPYAQSVYKTQKQNQYGMAAYSMTFAQGQGKFYLLIYYQLIDSYQNRLNFSTDGKYSVWDVSTSTMIANLDLIASLNWKRLCFQNSIYSKYIFYKNLIDYKGNIQGNDQLINNNLYIPHMTALVNIPNHLILGSVNGDLHIVKASALQYQGNNPSVKDMFIAKTYPGHCSQINQIQINPQKVHIFTTSILDQCILKYRIEGSTKINVQQQMQNNEIDIFSQVPQLQRQKQMLQIYIQKQNLSSRLWIDDDFYKKMNICQIIGRRASNLRNNIFYDIGGQIIYHIGHSIVIYNKQTKTKRFIDDKNSIYGNYSNQITQLQICQDNRSVIACYAGSNKSTVIQWDNNSKTVLKRFYVNQIVNIVLVAVNFNATKLIIYGIDKKGKASLVLIDFKSNQPLAVVSYAHKPAWCIKAISFAEQSQSIFYTCGVQQTKKWFFSGNQITYQQISLNNSTKTIHMCLLIMNKILITGGVDGYVYVWKNDLIKKMQHDNTVNCLVKSAENNQFFSGGKDGVIVMWLLQSNNLIVQKKISILTMINNMITVNNNMNNKNYNNKQKNGVLSISGTSNQLNKNSLTTKQLSFDLQIQSLYISNQLLLIGSRCGNILQIKIQQFCKQYQQNFMQIMFQFHDFQIVKAVVFGPDEKQLYEISRYGLFNVWRIQSYEQLYNYHFKQQVIDLLYHYKSNTIFIAFKKELKVFYLQKFKQSNSNIKQSNKHNTIASRANQQNNRTNNDSKSFYKINQMIQLSKSIKDITHIGFSKNQKMLCIGIESNSNKSISIQTYEIPQKLKQNKSKLQMLFVINLTSPILFFDFSTSNKYLLIRTTESLIIKDLADRKNINQQLISKIQWVSKGLIYGKQVQKSIIEYQKKWGQIEQIDYIDKQKSNLKQKQQNFNTDKLNKKKINKLNNIQTLSGLSQTLTLLRLSTQKYIIIQKYGSIYIYHGESLISKLTLPLTRIDHYSLSNNKNFVVLACQIDRLVMVVDINKSLGIQ